MYFETICETHFDTVALTSVASFLLLTLWSVSRLSFIIVYYIHKPLKGVFCYEDCTPGIVPVVLYITPRIVNQCHLLGSKTIFTLLLIKAIDLGLVSGHFNFIALLTQMLTEVVNRKYSCKYIRLVDLPYFLE